MLKTKAIRVSAPSRVAITSSVPQSVIDKAVDQWRTRLRACVKAKGHHLNICYRSLLIFGGI